MHSPLADFRYVRRRAVAAVRRTVSLTVLLVLLVQVLLVELLLLRCEARNGGRLARCRRQRSHFVRRTATCDQHGGGQRNGGAHGTGAALGEQLLSA